MTGIITVRKANQADIPTIQLITKEAFALYAKDLGQPEKVEALKESAATVRQELEEKHILLGLLDGQPMGSIRFQYIPGNLAYISRFGVRPGVQKSGLGKALIDAVAAQCKNDGISAIVLHTCTKMFRLVRYYYGQGFYIHSTTQDRGYVRGLFIRELGSETHETLNLDFVSRM